MKRIVLVFIMTMSILMMSACGKESKQFGEPKKGETVAEINIQDFGSIYVKFFKKEAPKAVENFITHAKDGYYDGVIFHRILEDFMIQGGDPTGTGRGGESIWGKDFEDEFDVNLHPYRGALCMANAGPNTNSSQFFIVQSKNTYDENLLTQFEMYYGVEYDKKAVKNYGEIGGTPWLFEMHTVFGQVYEGYDVLDAVAGVELIDEKNGIPAEQVIIDFIRIFEAD
ncbi:MAG: peptidylprolyl isomerase [Anaerolineaceae bacterium]|nr:MAG: peptidylprolyl isomerase [Anaerolineaceae bacterium]